MKNFDRTKIKPAIKNKDQKYKVLTTLIVCILSIICISILYNKKININQTNNKDFSSIIDIEKIDEFDLYENKLYEFFSENNLYYLIRINNNDNIENIYIKSSEISFIDSSKNPQIIVYKNNINKNTWNNLFKKYDEEKTYYYSYEIFINKNTIFENIGEIDLSSSQSGQFTWFIFPVFPFIK